MNPFLDPETQTYCTSCLRSIGQQHAEGCSNNVFENPAAAQKLLAWRETREDLQREDMIRALDEAENL